MAMTCSRIMVFRFFVHVWVMRHQAEGYPGRLRFVPARGPPAAGRKQQTPSRHLHRAEDSQPRFRHAPVGAATQRSDATPQLLLPSGIGSRFPAQAVELFSFDRNLRSIVAVGLARLESPWLRAR